MNTYVITFEGRATVDAKDTDNAREKMLDEILNMLFMSDEVDGIKIKKIEKSS